MILKNLTRRSGTGQVVKYILRYTMRMDKQAVRQSARQGTSYRDILRGLNITFTEKDLKYLEKEGIEVPLMNKYREYGYDFKQLWDRELSKQYNSTHTLVTHNMLTNSPEGFIREFNECNANREFKRKDQTEVHHTILSWSPKDTSKITHEMLKDMAAKFIKEAAANCKVVGSVHLDREHVHIHFVISGTMLNGRSSRISQREFQQVKIRLQEYQKEKYPELTNSLPKHKEKTNARSKEEIQKIKRNERCEVKNTLLKYLDAMPKQSAQELLEGLKTQGFTTYERNGKLTGLQHEDGLKFRFSRLDIDIDKLLEFDRQNEIMKEELKSLKEIRQGYHLQTRRDFLRENISKDDSMELDEKTKQELSELNAIRMQSNEKAADLDINNDEVERDMAEERDTVQQNEDDEKDTDIFNQASNDIDNDEEEAQ